MNKKLRELQAKKAAAAQAKADTLKAAGALLDGDDDGEENQRVSQFSRAATQQACFTGNQQGKHTHTDHRPKSSSR